MFGNPLKALVNNFLGKYPSITFMDLPSGHRLKFLMINTDADVDGYGQDRFYARGDFNSQLEKLDPLLDPPDENEIRVLLLHHSPAHRDYSLGISRRSRRALNDFIVKHHIAVLLSGHKHTPPLVKTFAAAHAGINRRYLEARCGTTTQQSTLSFGTTTLTGQRPYRPGQLANTLLIHRLEQQGAEISWNTECYFEIPTGFKEKSTFVQSPAILSIPIETPFKVLPLNT